MVNVGVTEWVPKWKANGWKLSNGGSVINREELEELEDSSSGLKVTYVSNTMSMISVSFSWNLTSNIICL